MYAKYDLLLQTLKIIVDFVLAYFFCRYNLYRRFFRVRNVVSHRVILCEYMQTLLYNITRLINCSFLRSARISFMSDSLYLLRPNDLIHFLYHFIRSHYSFTLKVCVWYCLPVLDIPVSNNFPFLIPIS